MASRLSAKDRRRSDEFLNTNEFITMQDVRKRLMAWQDDCNNRRPHGSIGRLTRASSLKRGQADCRQAARLRLRADRKRERRHQT